MTNAQKTKFSGTFISYIVERALERGEDLVLAVANFKANNSVGFDERYPRLSEMSNEEIINAFYSDVKTTELTVAAGETTKSEAPEIVAKPRANKRLYDLAPAHHYK